MNAAFNHGSQGDFFEKMEKTEDIKKSNSSRETGPAIRQAALDGKLETLIELLTKWKGDSVINEADSIGTTALHTACSHDHLECVKVLLEAGADKSLKNNYGQTAWAKTNNNDIKLLVKIPGYNKNNEEVWCIIA
jgi:hypothetical protein